MAKKGENNGIGISRVYYYSNSRVNIGAKKRFSKKIIKEIYPHLFLFSIRWILYSIVCILLNNSTNEYGRNKLLFYREMANDTIFLMMLNSFQFYLICKSIISGNLYAFYISIIFLAHNCILNILLAVDTLVQLVYVSATKRFWFAFTFFLISSILLCEFVLGIYKLYKNKNELNLTIFKKIGLSTKVNDAFASRKFLEAFGTILPFLSCSILLKDSVGTFYRSWTYDMLELGLFIVCIIDQCFYLVRPNDENPRQRKIAIGLSIIIIPYIIVLLLLEILGGSSSNRVQSDILYFNVIVLGDMIIVLCCLIYALISDYKSFGSGLNNIKGEMLLN